MSRGHLNIARRLGQFAVAWLCLAALAGCGPGALIACQLSAIKSLPRDPTLATARDAARVISSLHACDAAPAETVVAETVPAETPATSIRAPTTDAGP